MILVDGTNTWCLGPASRSIVLVSLLFESMDFGDVFGLVHSKQPLQLLAATSLLPNSALTILRRRSLALGLRRLKRRDFWWNTEGTHRIVIGCLDRLN